MSEPPTLEDRLEPRDWTGSLADVLTQVAKHAIVRRGTPLSDESIRVLEVALAMNLPADYREFLGHLGSLRVDGDPEYGFGQLEVFGAGTLLNARRRFREECNNWAGPTDWQERTSDRIYDQLRRAYREMVPVIQFSDVIHHGVDCIGPDARMHVVDIKSWAIEPDHHRSFTAQLLDRLRAVVVRTA